MKLELTNLLSVPALFEENPKLMSEVLNKEITKQVEDPHPSLRNLYTKCNCKEGELYWQNENVGNHDVEVFLCGNCQNWSMSVTY